MVGKAHCSIAEPYSMTNSTTSSQTYVAASRESCESISFGTNFSPNETPTLPGINSSPSGPSESQMSSPSSNIGEKIAIAISVIAFTAVCIGAFAYFIKRRRLRRSNLINSIVPWTVKRGNESTTGMLMTCSALRNLISMIMSGLQNSSLKSSEAPPSEGINVTHFNTDAATLNFDSSDTVPTYQEATQHDALKEI